MGKPIDYKRSHQRKTYSADIVFAHGDKAFNGTLQNVSIGGAFIATRDVGKISRNAMITITIPYTSGQKNVRRRGVVRWKNSEGFAIEFI